jgi:Fimbrial assembly protein (PilN)
MRAVNLLPKDAERARRTTPDPVMLIGVAGLAVVVAALFSMYMSASGKAQDNTSERNDRRTQLAAIRKKNPPPRVLPAQVKVAALRSGRIDAISNALAYRVPWNDILGQISLVMPSGVKLTTLTAATPVSANTVFSSASTTSGALSITGWAYSQESVVLLLTRLKILPPLTDVALVTSTRNSGASPVTYTFSLTARIRPPEAIS